jgi:eukaryotic-like serine/threonine-protein kinase
MNVIRMLPGPDESAASRFMLAGSSPAGDFSRLWRGNDAPSIDEFILRISERESVSPRDLAAVVRVDLRERWRRGQRPDAAEYLSKYAALAEAELAVDVIYAEFLVREELNEAGDAEEYRQRFPEYAVELVAQIRLHQAMEAEPDPPHSLEPLPSSDGIESEDGDYELLHEIGRGAMGVVYKARQVGLNRLVALKMVRPGEVANHELLARFRAEAEVVASLHHPHIVHIYDYGELDGLPYLALELVEGGTLAARLDGSPWQSRKAASLIAEVAHAVHFAHEKGVVHRDLKPANLLIESDSETLGIKIADFGLAKVFRDVQSSQTQTGALLGTPSYMAPEQAYGRTSQIGRPTDVYALGAILYELLTGRPPFRGETPLETLQQVLLAEPASVLRLAPHVPRDLVTICSKCLHREPRHRYATALELAEDLQRFLADQPIRARRTGGLERSWRWCRRNPTRALAVGSIATLLLLISVVSTWYSGRLGLQLERTRAAELTAREANDTSQRRLWDAYLAEAAALNVSRHQGQRFSALETLARAGKLRAAIGSSADSNQALRSATLSSLALTDLRRLRALPSAASSSVLLDLAVDADLYAGATADGVLVLSRLSDGHEVLRIAAQGPVEDVTLARSGDFLAARGAGRTQVWRIEEGRATPLWQADNLTQLEFLPDGAHVAVSGAAGMLLLDTASGNAVRKLGQARAESRFQFHEGSRRVLVSIGDRVQIISWETGEIVGELGPIEGATVMAWHPSGEFVAVWEASGVAIWNLESKSRVQVLPHRGFSQYLQFSHDGSRLVSYSLWDHRFIVWDIGSTQRLLEIKGFKNFAADVDRNGRFQYFQVDGPMAELWELDGGLECRSLAGGLFRSRGICQRATFSPDGRMIALSRERGFELWSADTGLRLAEWQGGPASVGFDSDGHLLVACEAGFFRWPRQEPDVPSAGESPIRTVRFGPPVALGGPTVPSTVATDAAVDLVVSTHEDGWRIRRLSKPGAFVSIYPDNGRITDVSPDGNLVGVANWDSPGATVWNGAGTHLVDLPVGHTGTLKFSPDSRLLATSPDGVRIWRVSDWKLICELGAVGSTPSGMGMAFSPDSRVIAVGQPNGVMRLANPLTGEDWARITLPDQSSATVIAFSPDQRWMFTMAIDDQSSGHIWNLHAIREQLAARQLAWPSDVLRTAQQSPPESERVRVELDSGSLQALVDAENEAEIPPATTNQE